MSNSPNGHIQNRSGRPIIIFKIQLGFKVLPYVALSRNEAIQMQPNAVLRTKSSKHRHLIDEKTG